MRKNICAIVVWIALAGLIQAGVVIELEIKNLRSDRVEGTRKISAQGEMLAMEDTDGKVMMIFRGDRMLTIDHRERSYMEIDETTMQEISGKLNEAMKQMREQMANMPAEQRAMMERMMKGRMPAGMDPIEIRVEAGANQRVGDYSCRMYSIYLNEDKSQELCAAPLNQVGAASEAWDAFQAMARFSQKMMDSFRQGPLAQMMNSNPFAMLDEIDGFPVLTRSFDKGAASEESRLNSIVRTALDPAVFEPPSGYRKKSMQDAMRGR